MQHNDGKSPMKKLGLAVAAGVVACSLIGATVASPAAMAKENRGQGWGQMKIRHGVHLNQLLRARFRDMQEASWALPIMQQMRLLGIINGYPDQTFRPNKPVTREEAVAMAVRFIGLEEEALERNADGDIDLDFADADKISPWARGYVAVAIEEGILDEDEGRFAPNQPAKRAWVAELAVRSMVASGVIDDANFEEDLKNAARVYYADLGSIEGRYRVYIVIASQRDWLHGYPDRTFRGNKPVTRAELLTIFGNINDTTNFFGQVRGELVSAEDGEITLDIRGRNQTYDVHENVLVYLDKEQVELDDLEAGVTVKVLLNDEDEVIFVEAVSDKDKRQDQKEGELEGEITALSSTRITLKTKNGTVRYSIDKNAEVEVDEDIIDDDDFGLDDLLVGDRVRVEIRNGVVTQIELLERVEDEQRNYEGIIESIEDDRIEIDLGSRDRTFKVSNNVRVTEDGKKISYDDLGKGDRVKVTVKNDEVVAIELLEDASERTSIVGVITGLIEEGKNRKIAVRATDGRTHTKRLTKDTEITLDGDEADFDDLEIGQEVELILEDDELIEIRAES